MVGGPSLQLGLKLVRDLSRSPAQVIAIALVVATAIAAVVMAANVRLSLDQTLKSYYAQYRFAHLFAEVEQAPRTLVPSINAIPGVAAAEARIATWAALEVPGLTEPAVGRVISLPAGRRPGVNRLALQAGRGIAAGGYDELVLAAPLASAHGLKPGDTLEVRIGGREQAFRIVGLALTPEAVFAVGPGEIVPNDRRYGLAWISEATLADLVGLPGKFNQVVLHLAPDGDERLVRDRLNTLLAPYGGVAAVGRADHPSHAFVQGQLQQLAAVALVLPPLFLAVAGFLLYTAMARIVTLERPQIGILKALGLSAGTIRAHYLLHAACIALAGCLLGIPLGLWMGAELLQLYIRFFHFPLVIRQFDPVAALAVCAVTFLVAYGSAAMAVRRVVRLCPAEAGRLAPPLAYSNRLRWPGLGERGQMVIRQVLRNGERTALTAIATALATALIVATLFSFDARDHMIDVVRQSERQDAILLASGPLSPGAITQLRGVPGVRHAEGFRISQTELIVADRRQTAPLVGLPADGSLKQLLSPALTPISPPMNGIALTTKLAELLNVGVGDSVTLRLPAADTTRTVTVSALTEQYFGIEAAVALATMDRWLGGDPLISGARIAIAPGASGDFQQTLRQLPVFAGYIDTEATLTAFRTTMTRTLTLLVSFFVLFAMLTTLGVVYSNARILLGERWRELAILRAVGASRREVAALLLVEVMLPTLIALPIGLGLGRVFGWLITENLESTLFRVPLVIAPRTDLAAAAFTLTAAFVAAWLIARPAARFKLAAVLGEGR
jgi:putative ABC transport system permease protein